MSRKPSNYWEKRSTSLMLSLEKDTQYTINDLIKIYEKATNNINKEIETIFKNYSKNNTLDKKVLKQLLNKKETDTHYKNLLKVIKTIEDENIKNKLLKKYNAPAYSYRISRLQALQENIDIEMKKIADLEQTITEARYVKTIDEAYNHTIFDIQQGTGVGFNFSQLDTDSIRLMLAEKWIDNQNFSQRIWKNTEKLGNYLKINLTADTMTGKSIQKISRDLSSYMNVGIYNATTLVRTEVNHFANESEALGYEECEIEKYQFIATLDNRTCDRCGSLDNKVFNVKDRCSGENYPPLHPNDRCTTVAYFDDEIEQNLQRRAKNENGKYIKVPANMNYSEWKEIYLEKDESVLQDIIYKLNTREYINVRHAKKQIINQAFKNNHIRQIALNTKIKDIRIGGNKSYHISGNIALVNNYNNRTLIHEIGHCVDYNNKWLSANTEFIQAIQKDKKYILKNKNLYKEIIKNNSNFRELSDIIGGMTNNEIVGRYKHNKKYWEKPHKLEREIFAQLFTIAGNNDTEQIEIFQEYLPNILNQFDDIIRRLL